jgi:hypothetical protein
LAIGHWKAGKNPVSPAMTMDNTQYPILNEISSANSRRRFMTAKQQDVGLILKLYELRRDEMMRRYFSEFHEILASGCPLSVGA